MRKVALTSAAVATVLGLAGVVAMSAASQAAEPSTAKSKTLTFGVVLSPFSLVATNNVRDPNCPIALGDEITFHDQLSRGSRGKVDDRAGTTVVTTLLPSENELVVEDRSSAGSWSGPASGSAGSGS